MLHIASATPLLRPRVVGNSIVIGNSTVLGRRYAANGCWEVEKPQPAALSKLLSVAYEKRISPTDDMIGILERAFAMLPRNPREADHIISGFPSPTSDTEEHVAATNRLLKSGIRPDQIEAVLRGSRLGLRSAPEWAEQLTLCSEGVVLGKGTVIAGLVELPFGGTGLDLDGREGAVLALLSLARRALAPADVLEKLASASRALSRGDASVAAIALAQLGQPPLTDEALAKSLNVAADRLKLGEKPLDLLCKAGFAMATLRKVFGQTETWRKLNRNRVPAGCPEGGQFCSGNAGYDPTYGGALPEPKLPLPPSPFTSWDAYRSHEAENAVYPQQPGAITGQGWQDMKDALDKRTDLTDTQKAAFLSIYGWEGGLKENKSNGSVAGLTGTALGRTDGDTPKTANDAINGYIDYFSDTMKTVGGVDALNQINDPKAAAAFADTDFYQGRSGGPRLLQQSVNEVLDRFGQPRIAVDRAMGPELLKAYAGLANNQDTRQALLDALYEKRVQWSEDTKRDVNGKNRGREREADRLRFASYR